jgi:hypothetical protein
MAMAAVLLAGPIGPGGVAAAGGGQESQLERKVDRLSPEQRAQLEREVAGGLARAGIDLGDPAVQARLAGALGVPTAQIERVVASADASAGVTGISAPIVFLFVAAALIFAPSIFQSIGGTLFEWLSEMGEIEGVEPF